VAQRVPAQGGRRGAFRLVLGWSDWGSLLTCFVLPACWRLVALPILGLPRMAYSCAQPSLPSRGVPTVWLATGRASGSSWRASSARSAAFLWPFRMRLSVRVCSVCAVSCLVHWPLFCVAVKTQPLRRVGAPVVLCLTPFPLPLVSCLLPLASRPSRTCISAPVCPTQAA